jgi:predicted TIM-barrel fold metal-dependent hydrolase
VADVTARNLQTEDTATTSPAKTLLIDCDVHPMYKSHWKEALAPYFSRAWQVRLVGDVGYKGPDADSRPAIGYRIPPDHFYPLGQNPLRNELFGPNLPPPASDPEITGRALLDHYGIASAILIDQNFIGTFPDAQFAGQIASASNQYYAEHWLAKDSRWRGSIEVAWQSPTLAIKEIEKWGPSKQWASVLVTPGNILMGYEHFFPIYEAAEHFGLPIQLHVSGALGVYRSAPSFAGGMPIHHLDYRVLMLHADQANLANMISNGVFERYPKLKLVITESGFAWLPQLMWQMDAHWKANRESTPWLRRRPSEYIIDHVRFTTQPFIEPERHQHIETMLEMIHAERTLMFSTDYPHWDADEPSRILSKIPARFRERVTSANALETFGDRLL